MPKSAHRMEKTMKINNIHHIAINTRDLKKSIQFYTEILKFRFVEEADLGNDYVAYIEYAPNSVLELFKMDGKLTESALDDTVVGLKHIAFHVDELEKWDDYLKKSNIPYWLELTRIEPIQKKVLLIEAPDHVIIELCEDY